MPPDHPRLARVKPDASRSSGELGIDGYVRRGRSDHPDFAGSVGRPHAARFGGQYGYSRSRSKFAHVLALV